MANKPWEPSASDIGCEVAPSAVAITEEALAEYEVVGRLYLQRLVEWLETKCEDHGFVTQPKKKRRACWQCWQELRQGVEKK